MIDALQDFVFAERFCFYVLGCSLWRWIVEIVFFADIEWGFT